MAVTRRSGTADPARRAAVAGWMAAAAVIAACLAGCGAGGGTARETSAGPAASAGATESAAPASGQRSGQATESGTPSADGAGTSAAAASAGASATAEPTAESWKTYTDSGHTVSFDLPQDWIAQRIPEGPGVPPGTLKVQVRDASGTLVATLNTGIQGLGGACNPAHASPYTVLVSVPMDIPSTASDATSVPPRFVYRLLQGKSKFYGSYGITDHAAGANGKICLAYNVVSGPGALRLYMFGDVLQLNSVDGAPAGLRAFNTIAEAQQYLRTGEFQNLLRMITSLKITS